jgi:hypothetical protein
VPAATHDVGEVHEMTLGSVGLTATGFDQVDPSRATSLPLPSTPAQNVVLVHDRDWTEPPWSVGAADHAEPEKVNICPPPLPAATTQNDVVAHDTAVNGMAPSRSTGEDHVEPCRVSTEPRESVATQNALETHETPVKLATPGTGVGADQAPDW